MHACICGTHNDTFWHFYGFRNLRPGSYMHVCAVLTLAHLALPCFARAMRVLRAKRATRPRLPVFARLALKPCCDMARNEMPIYGHLRTCDAHCPYDAHIRPYSHVQPNPYYDTSERTFVAHNELCNASRALCTLCTIRTTYNEQQTTCARRKAYAVRNVQRAQSVRSTCNEAHEVCNA